MADAIDTGVPIQVPNRRPLAAASSGPGTNTTVASALSGINSSGPAAPSSWTLSRISVAETPLTAKRTNAAAKTTPITAKRSRACLRVIGSGGFDDRPRHKVVAAVGPADPGLVATVVVGSQQNQLGWLAANFAAAGSFRVKPLPDSREAV